MVHVSASIPKGCWSTVQFDFDSDIGFGQVESLTL